jgi:hypothetical protein
VKASISKDGKTLVVEIPLETPRTSTSGKTMLVASTGGFKSTEAKHGDKTISINLTATIPNK